MSGRGAKPKLDFYGVLDGKGGVSIDEALRRADAGLEAHRKQANAMIRFKLRELNELAAARTPDSDALYERAAYILDIAGLFLPPLCRASFSLCDLITRMAASGRWDWPSVDVHLAAMRLLLAKSDDKDPSVQTMLSGLGAVVGRHPDPAGD